jgi:hypothetical protein
MSPNTFFHGKINIYLSKGPEERDLIQSAKNKGLSALNRNAVHGLRNAVSYRTD